MIENALVFALGAIVAGLLALILFPAFTRRAARLARRDTENRLPRTAAEVAAFNDAVRAEYAARSARVEHELDRTRDALVAERLERSRLDIQIAALSSERRGYDGGLAEAEDRVSGVFAELREREERLARVTAEKRELERRIAGEASREKALEDRLADAVRIATEMRRALVVAEARATAIADEFEGRTGERPQAEALVLDFSDLSADRKAVAEGPLPTASTLPEPADTVAGQLPETPVAASADTAPATPGDGSGPDGGGNGDEDLAAAGTLPMVDLGSDLSPTPIPAPPAAAPARAAEPIAPAVLADRIRAVRRAVRKKKGNGENGVAPKAGPAVAVAVETAPAPDSEATGQRAGQITVEDLAERLKSLRTRHPASGRRAVEAAD